MFKKNKYFCERMCMYAFSRKTDDGYKNYDNNKYFLRLFIYISMLTIKLIRTVLIALFFKRKSQFVIKNLSLFLHNREK